MTQAIKRTIFFLALAIAFTLVASPIAEAKKLNIMV